MNWTKERPTKPGHYWAYDEEYSKKIFLIQIENEYALGFNDEIYLIENFSHFMGPLNVPEPPND